MTSDFKKSAGPNDLTAPSLMETIERAASQRPAFPFSCKYTRLQGDVKEKTAAPGRDRQDFYKETGPFCLQKSVKRPAPETADRNRGRVNLKGNK